MSSTLSPLRNGVSLGHAPSGRVDRGAAGPVLIVDDVVSRIRLGHTVVALTAWSAASKAVVAGLLRTELPASTMRVMEVGCGDKDALRLNTIAAQLLGRPEEELGPRYAEDLFAILTQSDEAGRRIALIVNDAECLQADALAYLSLLVTLAKAAAPRIVFVGLPAFWQAIELGSASGLKNLVTARWTLHADDTPPDSEVSALFLPDDSPLPRSKSLAVARNESPRVTPIRSRAEHLKRIAGSVVAVGLAFFGIIAATALTRQGGERPAAVTVAPAGLSVKISLAAADGAVPPQETPIQPSTFAAPAFDAEPVVRPAPVPVAAAGSQEAPAPEAKPDSLSPAVQAVPAAADPPTDTVRRDPAPEPAPPPPTVSTTATIENAPAVAAPPTQATPIQAPPSEATVAEVKALLTRGDAMLAMGDIAAARLFYNRAASVGSGRAATMMGKTFDKRYLATIQVSGVAPDQALATTWYRRGAALGDSEAADRLARSEATGAAK